MSSGNRINPMAILNRCGQYVTKLKIRESLTTSVIMAVSHLCYNLVDFELNMEYCPKTLVMNNSLFQGMENLKSIKLTNYHDFNGETAEQNVFHSLQSQVSKIFFAAKFSHQVLPKTFKKVSSKFKFTACAILNPRIVHVKSLNLTFEKSFLYYVFVITGFGPVSFHLLFVALLLDYCRRNDL